jgi:hypothetical protein
MFASLPFCSGAYSSHTEYTDTVDRIDLVVGFGAHDELVLMDGQDHAAFGDFGYRCHFDLRPEDPPASRFRISELVHLGLVETESEKRALD